MKLLQSLIEIFNRHRGQVAAEAANAICRAAEHGNVTELGRIFGSKDTSKAAEMALTVAAEQGHQHAVEYLLGIGVSPYARFGAHSAFEAAHKAGHNTICALLEQEQKKHPGEALARLRAAHGRKRHSGL